jgi:3-methyl-2-oxobutanoate hydroxymethyltransferase
MKATTMSQLRQWKQEKHKFATITAYDASFAQLFAEQGIPVMLIGDSLGMVVQGQDSTLPVTLEDIVYHTRCVRRGAPKALLLSDLPFMTYATPEQTFDSAAQLMRAGANMVKLEGGSWLCDTVSALTERAVPVGGYKVQGRGEAAANQLLQDALALQKAGIQLLVLECVPVELARRVTEELTIPVIGIGAGNATDGQILVMHDAFGITGGHIPKFAKDFLAEAGDIRVYPGPEHSFQ